jgi:tubulin-specific chaperone A
VIEADFKSLLDYWFSPDYTVSLRVQIMNKKALSLIVSKMRTIFQSLRVDLTSQSISAKLNIITLGAIIGMLVLGSLSIFTLMSLETSFEEVRVLYSQGEKIDKLLNLILKTLDGLHQVIDEGDESFASKVLVQQEEMLSAFSAYQTTAQQAGLSDDHLLAIENEPIFLKIRDLSFEAIAHLRQGHFDEARNLREQVEQNTRQVLVWAEQSAFTRQTAIADQLAEIAALREGFLYLQIGVFVAGSLLVFSMSYGISRGISKRLAELTAITEQITAGDLNIQAPVKSSDEIGLLATAFNQMTHNLRQMIEAEQSARENAAQLAQAEREAKAYMEQVIDNYLVFIERVAVGDLTAHLSLNGDNNALTILGHHLNNMAERLGERTTQLQTVALLSERLNAVLDFDQLLIQLVNQVKDSFDYYHTHIYILTEDTSDGSQRTLALHAGAGEAGAKMIARGHAIPLNAPTSLVARAARTGEIVWVDNVYQAEDWLPNPLLPDTHAEMAVPIIVEGQVVGVLDVQEDKIGGLNEGDANLLRSLANQVAVALTNARLFEQTIQSKEEAESAKEKAEQARAEAELTRKDIEIANKALEVQVWQTAGQTLLNERTRGEQDIPTLARNVIQQLCQYLNAQVGTLYVLENHVLKLVGSYAYIRPKNHPDQFQFGESLVGQAALEKQPIVIADIPADYITITSSLGAALPKHLLVAPFIYDGQVIGVVELGMLSEFSPAKMEFLQNVLESIAIAFITAQARSRVNELLAETQQQAEELQAQEEELRTANEELEIQAESLRASEVKLRMKQAELEEVNTELEEKAEVLEKNSAMLREQRAALDQQNQALKVAQQALEQKAEELERTSKYKSEFLANMSHELRTPLNSLLILARMLAQNKEGNLTPEQVESAQIMYSGGVDLLNLINDILDLSKVEAGKLELHFAPMSLERLVTTLRSQFTPVAEDKGLMFEITLADDVPDTIETDPQRVQQILKNLLSNAFKFTEHGSVCLEFCRPQPNVDLSKSGLDPTRAIAIRVTDTGIGMTPEQQGVVFEAFQQADGSTSRQYGGTGLGLSISRELVMKLGGQVELLSEKGQGSAFTLYLPIERSAVQGPEDKIVEVTPGGDPKAPAKPSTPPPPPLPPAPTEAAPQPVAPTFLPDDRDDLQEGDRRLLIIEDDPEFAKLVFIYAHKKNFKCLVAGDGETGLHLARTYKADAIILDLYLPGISGWEVLDALKNDPDTRHIPVHIMSALNEDLDAYKRGAMGFLTKPISLDDMDKSFQRMEQFISRKIKTLLLVEDDTNLRKSVRKLLEGNDIAISEASLGQAALEQLAAQHFDCMILDLSLPDMSGFELLNRMDGDDSLPKCPVIVYTGKALTEEENRELLRYADSVIVKGVKSPERLLDETALFLHRVIANMPEEKQRTIKRLYDNEAMLEGKEVLIVDDDARNAFALSKLLADKGLKVHIVPSGQKALELLDKTPVDLVLMDIMMPGMDGYEATQRIRAQQRFHSLPILALTAKAMKGDREKCIAAGANDYLSKPIDADRLFSMLRVWLNKE